MKSIVLPPLSLLVRRRHSHASLALSSWDVSHHQTRSPRDQYRKHHHRRHRQRHRSSNTSRGLIAAQGKKVCILTRGYGRKDPHLQVIVSDGYGVLASPSEAGDEPYLLATKLKGLAAVISSADRIAAGQEAIKDFGTECFVLDDGFQHLRLARDLNIVTIDATNPWGGGTSAAVRATA